MVQVKKVGVLSAAKVGAVIEGVFGLCTVPIFLLLGGLQMLGLPGTQRAMATIYVVLGLLAPFFYAAIGFIVAAIAALIYNWFAGRFGGLELELTGSQLTATVVPAP